MRPAETVRLVVLESGLKSIFAGLGLGLGGSASKSFFKSFVGLPMKTIHNRMTDYLAVGL